MHAGHVISGAGHGALIGWMLIAGWLTPAHEPFEMTEVSVISGEEFDAMLAAARPPESVTEVAQPAAPAEEAEPPEVSSTPDTEITQPPPVQTEVPAEEAPPEVTELELPPETVVEDTAPELAEPPGDVAVLVPEVAPEAAPRPIERVAPEPVAQPAAEALPDPVEQEAVAPDAEGEAVEQESQEATAPEEATTEIVTEATQAPAASIRPPGRRPAPPVRQAAATPQASSDQQDSSDDVDAAVQAALEAAQSATQPAPSAPSGPPLSAGEKDALRVAVSQCWNIGSLSTEALGTTVVIAVQMNQDGTPVANTIRMLSSTGGSGASAQRVFDSARRAIIRCGARGYDLPADKFEQWRNIEMTFDPRKMGF